MKRDHGLSRGASAGAWLLASAVAGSALAVGTVHTATLGVVTAVLGVATVLVWWRAEPLRTRPAATLLAITALFLTAFTAAQCLPLPASFLGTLARHNANVWSRALAPLHQIGPAWAPISVDPAATRIEIAKGLAYLLAFVASVRIARDRHGASFLSATIVVTGGALAAAALLHPAFGAHKLFGLYTPDFIPERHLAPLMNPNNLAGYVNVALCLAVAAAISPRPRVPRPVAGAIVILLGATQMWVASRGGVVTMVLGVLIVVTLASTARSRHPAMTVALVVGVAASLGAALVVAGTSQEATDELLQADASKLSVVWRMMRMLPAVPWVGCGRGAFESAFPAFRTEPGYVSFVYPENFVAQWALEWGVPVTLLGLAAIAVALRPTAVLARSTTSAGAWAALVALGVQNLADLGSEVPGVVLAGVVCAAIVTGGTRGREAALRIERWAEAPTAVALAAVLAAAAGVTLAIGALGKEIHDDRALLQHAAGDPGLSAERMRGLAAAAMLRHPAEPYLPLMVALRASNRQDDNPVPWIGATLERARVYGPAHLLLARVVAARSPSQARLEYRFAMEQMPEATGSTVREAIATVNTYYDATEIVPAGPPGEVALEVLAETLAQRLPSTSTRLDDDLRRRDSANSLPALRRAQGLVEDVEIGDAAPWCQGPGRDACVKAALEAATRATQLAPGRCDGYALLTRARLAGGDRAKALDELEQRADELPDRVACLEMLAPMALATGDEVRAERVLDKVVSAGCADDAACAAQLKWAATQEEERGHLSKALSLLRRAHERAPDDDGIDDTAGRLSSRLGLHAEAADAYERLAQRHPRESRWQTASAAERALALRGTRALP